MTVNQKRKVLRFGNYINGSWIDRRSSQVIESTNPADFNEIVGIVQSSSTCDVDDAVHAAKDALNLWKNTSSVERGNYLNQAADIMEDRLEEIAEIATREMGKTLGETRGEVLRAAMI